ncbi:hypothetical protein ACTWP5_13800 [Streptomyces sp. 4N509B]|uniref:hypothetical protein n=1 Tax=Streptomyces sp. 4N509B TaxID=3457413 RepID=UPI003FCF7A64
MTDARGVCAGSATGLASGVSYVRGWADAKTGADALAEQLRALDVGHLFAGLKADVNVNGDGIVHLGQIRPATAQLLATLIVQGLTMEVLSRETTDARPHPTP